MIFDSGVDSSNYVAFVATNNYAAGQMAARKLAQLLDGKGIVGIIGNAPGSASTIDRENGFKDALARDFPGIKIAAEQYGMSDAAKGLAVTENILTAHPEVTGLFASASPVR